MFVLPRECQRRRKRRSCFFVKVVDKHTETLPFRTRSRKFNKIQLLGSNKMCPFVPQYAQIEKIYHAKSGQPLSALSIRSFSRRASSFDFCEQAPVTPIAIFPSSATFNTHTQTQMNPKCTSASLESNRINRIWFWRYMKNFLFCLSPFSGRHTKNRNVLFITRICYKSMQMNKPTNSCCIFFLFSCIFRLMNYQ